MTNTLYDSLYKQATENQTKYVPFTTDRLLTYGLHRKGMNYLLQILQGIVDRDHARFLYTTDREWFVAYIEECWAKLPPKKQDKDHFAAIVHNEIRGILVNVNPFFNQWVLDSIKEHGLDGLITHATFDPSEMQIFFMHTQRKGIKVGFAVWNGETGQTTYGYALRVKTANVTFDVPLQDRRKHLTRLGLVEKNLKQLYEEVKDILFLDYLENTRYTQEYTELLTSKEYEKLDGKLTFTTLENAIINLTLLANTHGFKGVCTSAMQKILDYAYNNYEREKN